MDIQEIIYKMETKSSLSADDLVLHIEDLKELEQELSKQQVADMRGLI